MEGISGLFEFLVGTTREGREPALRYWAELGFRPVTWGRLDASQAEQRYGHRSAVTSYRLAHPGCALSGCGYVRLMVWDEPRDSGLGHARPLEIGSRWMGVYTSNILLVRDAFTDAIVNEGWDFEVTPIVRAPLDPAAPPSGFFNRWVGLREMFVIGPETRHAFIQRNNFDRPGFGSFSPATPLPVTEGTHGNIVQPHFATEFYREVLGLVSQGGAHDSGWERESTRVVLMLEEGQTFTVERLGSPNRPSGFLQVYAPHWNAPDRRAHSRAGSLGLSQFSYQVPHAGGLRDAVLAAGATEVTDRLPNEFGEPSFSFVAPDGISWTIVGRIV
ncbi:MAG: hypothetical protein K6U89_12435 [Chloroflexi bacterium]|nr:hypothetical protein [Chloroflexota bacterium]GIW11943.1 MAG: hypothetical protein KatS3mg061_3000 [Dehalococcoidia bacterium]